MKIVIKIGDDHFQKIKVLVKSQIGVLNFIAFKLLTTYENKHEFLVTIFIRI